MEVGQDVSDRTLHELAAAWRNGEPGEVYNFGGRCEKANLDLTRLLLRLLGKPETLIKYVADRPGHVPMPSLPTRPGFSAASINS